MLCIILIVLFGIFMAYRLARARTTDEAMEKAEMTEFKCTKRQLTETAFKENK